MDHILGHKSNFSKFKKTEIVSSMFPNHNAMRLNTNYKKKTVKNTKTWRLNISEEQNKVKKKMKRMKRTEDHLSF